MATRDPLNLIVAIALIVIGILLVTEKWSLDWILGILWIALIVLGILILVNVLPGGKLIGIAALAVGILLAVNVIPFPTEMRRAVNDVMDIVNIVAGVVCIILGIMKLRS